MALDLDHSIQTQTCMPLPILKFKTHNNTKEFKFRTDVVLFKTKTIALIFRTKNVGTYL